MEGSCPAACNVATSCPGPGASAMFFTTLISSLLQSERELADSHIYPTDASNFMFDEYDFIVVGAGTAGSVIASRISEVPQWKVLVIEAGGDPPFLSNIPAIFFALLKTEVDWQYHTEPHDGFCQGFVGKRCFLPRGKALGGTSSINGMLYFRGVTGDFDNWATAGNKGWSDKEVLEFFKKSEDFKFEGDGDNSGPDYHGAGGPLKVQRLQTLDLAVKLAEGLKEAGYKELNDVIGPDQHGFGHLHATITNGTRCSSAKAFLAGTRDRKNLHVVKNSQVTKIIIDHESKEVKGVEFVLADGRIRSVKVRKEVIVSAGTVNSPQVLMLSGIGPKRHHLTDVGIETIKDLKVGENFHDHFLFLATLSHLLDDSYEYLTRRTGRFTTYFGTSVVSYFKTKLEPEDQRPDMMLVFLSILANDTSTVDLLEDKLDLEHESADSIKEMIKEGDAFFILPMILRTKSRGRVLLSSADPLAHPKIYPEYLSDSRDLETMLEGIRTGIELMETDIMKQYGAKKQKLFVKSCEDLEYDSREYWECMLRNVGGSFFHPVGTCKMGPRTDSEAVVDPELKVHGLKGIRVADASVMPVTVSSPPYATVVMIGEKAADMIKREWL
ncbi:hypothetical protein L9F63_028111 [Diploptera punctata]|uniref:Glucose-methanol-choline oxidoreductase N-terminal domain-containing protein n=1 Tax=Diploptera punctata TaxID=6984 RepID=A0AAD8EG39_DIPPU|nr:hypothetical protein L9F63_028111 [Diploptera punctata]